MESNDAYFSLQPILFKQLSKDNDEMNKLLFEDEDEDKYKLNLVRLMIYFEQFAVEKIVEQPAYQVSWY